MKGEPNPKHMEEGNRNDLYFGWIVSSLLITLALLVFMPSLTSGETINTIIIVAILFLAILFLWLLPFLFVRAFYSTMKESRKKSTR